MKNLVIISFRDPKYPKTKKVVENLAFLYYLLIIKQNQRRFLDNQIETCGFYFVTHCQNRGDDDSFFFKKK